MKPLSIRPHAVYNIGRAHADRVADESRGLEVSKFAESLTSSRFKVTCELNPPKGANLKHLYKQAEMLSGMVDAFNITDSASSIMTMAPLAVSHLLLDKGIETILQITGRDRNRIALQSELIAAHALGITNVLCMSGDPPSSGDHPDAKAVFDLEAVGLLRATKALQSGVDLAGNDLKGTPSFCAGAVVNPGASDLDKELRRMEEKIEAGAAFFQTQAVYDTGALERFMSAAEGFNIPVLAGQIVLKSSRMAQYLNANLPGVHVPDEIIREMEGAESREERQEKSVYISARIIREIQGMCQGVHVMAIGWEAVVPKILRAAAIV